MKCFSVSDTHLFTKDADMDRASNLFLKCKCRIIYLVTNVKRLFLNLCEGLSYSQRSISLVFSVAATTILPGPVIYGKITQKIEPEAWYRYAMHFGVKNKNTKTAKIF
jgi:hypothetical protein